MNSIFLALAKLDITAHAQGKNPKEFTIHVGDSSITFKLDDPKAKVDRESWRTPADARRPASDPLQLAVSWHLEMVDGLRLAWSDTKEAAIEMLLRQIVIELVVAGEMQVRASELHSYA